MSELPPGPADRKISFRSVNLRVVTELKETDSRYVGVDLEIIDRTLVITRSRNPVAIHAPGSWLKIEFV